MLNLKVWTAVTETHNELRVLKTGLGFGFKKKNNQSTLLQIIVEAVYKAFFPQALKSST